MTPWYRDPLIWAIGTCALGILLLMISSGVRETEVRQDLTARGFIEVRYKGHSVFVRPEDTHHLVEVSP